MATNTLSTSKDTIEYFKTMIESCSSVITESVNTMEQIKKQMTLGEHVKYSSMLQDSIVNQSDVRKKLFSFYNSIDKELNIISHDDLLEKKALAQEKMIQDLMTQNQTLSVQLEKFANCDILQKYEKDMKIYNDKITNLDSENAELKKCIESYKKQPNNEQAVHSKITPEYIQNISEQVSNIRHTINKSINSLNEKHVKIQKILTDRAISPSVWGPTIAEINILKNDISTCGQQQYIIEMLLQNMKQLILEQSRASVRAHQPDHAELMSKITQLQAQQQKQSQTQMMAQTQLRAQLHAQEQALQMAQARIITQSNKLTPQPDMNAQLQQYYMRIQEQALKQMYKVPETINSQDRKHKDDSEDSSYVQSKKSRMDKQSKSNPEVMREDDFGEDD